MSSQQEKGFTLIELLVALAVSGIVLAGLTTLFTSSTEIYTSQDQIVRLEQDLRATMDMMARGIRMAGLDPTGCGCAVFFDPTNATSISFRMDYNSNGNCTDEGPEESLSYSFSSADNEIQEDGERIATDIVSLDLCYWLQGGANCITDPDPNDLNDIRRVDITICGRISGSYAGKYDNDICLTSSIRCRNLGI